MENSLYGLADFLNIQQEHHQKAGKTKNKYINNQESSIMRYLP